MLNWISPDRRARSAHVEACTLKVLEEATLASSTVTLFQAALRLQIQARASGIALGFDQALYRLRQRDRARVLVR